ncbi:MAG: hypothetical protein ACRD18_17350 [Terriglobia bacterium]
MRPVGWFGIARALYWAKDSWYRPALCVALAFSAASLPARPTNPQVQIPLIVAKGVPLHIKLQTRVPIKYAGVPVEGRLTAPVYVYDRIVIPAGSEVLGRVIKVQNCAKLVRARAIMNGSFTPLRTAQVEFDTLVLQNGTRIPISTLVMPGAAPAIQLASGGNKKKTGKDPVSGVLAGERERLSEQKDAVVAAIREPGKIRRLKKEAKALVVAEIPYHRQAFQPGTVFTAEIRTPLKFGVETLPAAELSEVGSPPPPESIIHARLVTPLDSATAHQGAPVEAIVTEPLFSAKHQLIIPQGSQLEGTVVQAKAARRLRRNGKLRFTFQRIELPTARPEIIHASVERVEVAKSAHLKLDAEGGVEPVPSKKKYIAPALSLLLAMQAATPDRDAVSEDAAGAVPGQGGVTGKLLAGGWGFGLVGSALTLVIKSRALTATLGFYGAAWSIYSNLLARGQDVVFPAHTPMEIRLGSHQRPGSKMPLPPPPLPAVPHG